MSDEEDDDDDDRETGDDVDVLEKSDEKLKEPDMYAVVLHNDDYTTKEFVVEVLASVFHKHYAEATNIMLRAHRNGKAVVEVYTWDIAVTKIDQVHRKAKARGFPLRCSVEKQ